MPEDKKTGYSVLRVKNETLARIRQFKQDISATMGSDDYIVSLLLDEHYESLEKKDTLQNAENEQH